MRPIQTKIITIGLRTECSTSDIAPDSPLTGSMTLTWQFVDRQSVGVNCQVIEHRLAVNAHGVRREGCEIGEGGENWRLVRIELKESQNTTLAIYLHIFIHLLTNWDNKFFVCCFKNSSINYSWYSDSAILKGRHPRYPTKQRSTVPKCQTTSGYMAPLFLSIGRMLCRVPTPDDIGPLFFALMRTQCFYLHQVDVANQNSASSSL